MDTKRLVGEDAEVYSASLGSQLDGNDSSTLDTLASITGGGYFRIVSKAASSALPAALAVNDPFHDDGSLVMATGDSVKLFTLTQFCEITSFNINLTKADIDITTLCDLIKSWRMGKPEGDGAADAIRTVGGSDAEQAFRASLITQFMPVITDNGAGTYAKTAPNDNLLWVIAKLNEATKNNLVPTDKEHIGFFPVRLTSLIPVELGIDAPQSFNMSFRLDGREGACEYIRTIPSP